MSETPTVSVVGPDPDHVIGRLLASLTHTVARTDGPADIAIVADTAHLAEAQSLANDGVVVLGASLQDTAALGAAAGDVPVALGESVAGSPALFESLDALRQVVANATFVDVCAMGDAGEAPIEALFDQVRLLTAIDSGRALALDSAVREERAISVLATWGGTDVSLCAATTAHERPRVTATFHSAETVARVSIPASADLEPGRVSIESADGTRILPAVYESGDRSLVRTLARDGEWTVHAGRTRRFLKDAGLVRSVAE